MAVLDPWLSGPRGRLCPALDPNISSANAAGWSILTCKHLLAYGVRVGDVFKALADPTRRTILDELANRNGQTLFEICARLMTNHGLNSSRQAISQHLDVLERAGLVETRREGRYKFHYLNTAPLEPVIERWFTKSATDVSAAAPMAVSKPAASKPAASKPRDEDRDENQSGERAR